MVVCQTCSAPEGALAREIYQTVKIFVNLSSSSIVPLRCPAMGWTVMPSLWLMLHLAELWEEELGLVWRLAV